ncbi:MAG: hypothetical protein HUK02_07500, partial [Bacteroidaceae bacterium]|nr:hypothetical protein [Bacteroidaceae bacterium]
MFKHTICALLLALTALGVQAKFVGESPVSGTQYYLLNVYQSKFLQTEGTVLKTAKEATPALWTVTGSSVTIGNVTYQIAASDGGYTLTSAGGALMFQGGSYVHDDATGKDFLCIPGGGQQVTTAPITNNTTCDCAQWKFITQAEYNAMMAKKTFTACALNVDGMPKEIKAAGIITITLNDDAKEGLGATAIGRRLNTSGYDVVGLMEDFNFHSEIMAQATDYTAMTHRGKIESTAEAIERIAFQKSPVFDIDGLELLTRNAHATASGESWTAWASHNGYTDSGADGLIDKGYRYYTITLTDGTEFDLYILHMDAETNPADNAAREAQLQQLAQAILASNNGRPILVMGDTNCRYTRDPLQTKFINLINADARFTCKDAWIEHVRDGIYPAQNGNSIMVDAEGYRRGEVVDKIFYINNTASNIRIAAEQFRQDLSFVGEDGYPLADHWPIVVEFSFHNYDPAIDDVEEELHTQSGLYLRNRATGYFLKAGGRWGTHAVQGDYGLPCELTQLSDGQYVLNSAEGNVNHGAYMDGSGADKWQLTQQGDFVTFSFIDSGKMKALSAADPFIFSEHTPFNPTSPNQRYVWVEDFNANSQYQQWQLLTKEQLLEEALFATPDHPFDLTFMLPGANFDRNDPGVAQWPLIPDRTRMWENYRDGYSADNDYSNFVGEVYVADRKWTESDGESMWDVYQVLQGLPKGQYRVTCQAFQRISNDNTTTAQIYLYANDGSHLSMKEDQVPAHACQVQLMYDVHQTEIEGSTTSGGYKYPNTMTEAAHFFNAGYYQNSVDGITVTDGTMTVGMCKTSKTGKYNNAWTCFDNFRIYYLGAGTPLEVTTNAEGWATYAPSEAVMLPTGEATFSYVESVEGRQAKVTEFQQNSVPAGTGMLVKTANPNVTVQLPLA